MASKSLFATVGTTQFDKFIEKITSSEVLKVLHGRGYTQLMLQIGRGSYEPVSGHHHGVHINWYRFKDSLASDIQSADLVVSHAGAGTCLEVLEAGRKLLVVVNEDLMDNHQTELAQQLQRLGYLHYCTCDQLGSALRDTDFTNTTPYVRGNADPFVKHLDSLMNFVR